MTDWTDARRMQTLAVAANILEQRATDADPAHPIVEDVAILRDMRERLATKEAAYQRLSQTLDVPVELFGTSVTEGMRREFTKPTVGIDPGDPEAEPVFAEERDDGIVVTGGWCAPSDQLLNIAPDSSVLPDFFAPRVVRGGIKFGEVHAPKREPEPQAPSPDGSAGHWEYGVDVSDFEDEEPEIYASASAWHWEPFLTADEARDTFDGPVVKRWVRDADEWREA